MGRARFGRDPASSFLLTISAGSPSRVKQEKRARSFGTCGAGVVARTSGTGEVRSRRTIASARPPCNAANVTDDAVIPPFDTLPLLPGSGVQHAWDVWGRGDNLGMLNRLTGPVVAAAASGVRTGERVGVSLPLGLPDPPFFGRKSFRHSFEAMAPGVWDDWVDGFYLQCSTQWDGLRHI